MSVGLIVIAAALVVLLGLIVTTEKVLTHREDHVVIDVRMTDHRSRM